MYETKIYRDIGNNPSTRNFLVVGDLGVRYWLMEAIYLHDGHGQKSFTGKALMRPTAH